MILTGLSTINGGISLGFVLGSLLLLLHVNNFNQAIKMRKTHHFCR